MASPTLRSRHIPPSTSTLNLQDSSSSYSDTPADSTDDDDDAPSSKAAHPSPASIHISLLDILRILAGLLLLNCTLSYFITSDSLFWNQRPAFTRPARIRASLRGPLLLTDSQLALYNGTDPHLPVLLALNGTIYDVTEGRRFYGPGGMYGFFSGRDATRAFVTGCFEEDLTPDLRGVEEMFVPLDGPEEEGDGGDKGMRAERKKRREREWRVARQRVRDTVSGWEKLFDGGKRGAYFRVGKVVREEGWEERLGPVRELCEKARKGRVKRGEGSTA